MLHGFLILAFWLSGAETKPELSADSLMVRAAYAKLANAVTVERLRNSVYSGQSATPGIGGGLEIALSGFRSGPISDILDRNLEELTTKPAGPVLQVTPGDWKLNLENGAVLRGSAASVTWRDAPYLTEDWAVPVRRAVESLEPSYSRYCSFAVKLSWDGRTRQYVALFLFGEDERGAPKVLPVDHIVGLSALSDLIKAPTVPEPLTVPPFAGDSGVKSFFESARAAPGCAVEPLTGLCCDRTTGFCGIRLETGK